MNIINQPFQGQLGSILIDELTQGYDQFVFFSAFAKNSGVLRMKPALRQFRAGGGKITAFIGIDLNGTSYEALLNLFYLCDHLYVIHSEDPATTYHSKVYLLTNDRYAWCAVGSNNFTGGGLWTNFESCSICKYEQQKNSNELLSLQEIIQKYMDDNYQCSAKIASAAAIEALLGSNYISKEASQKIASATRRINQQRSLKKLPLFGCEKVNLPAIIHIEKQQGKRSALHVNVPMGQTLESQSSTGPAFTHEQFWFEMRESTGGSRNILDLSKLGKIESGSVSGTPYQYTDNIHMYGGIKFFEIDPDNVDMTKNITINYQGKDYFPSTIKFAPNNGSWRIQLKGSPDDGTEELSKYGNRGDFVHKILIFEKISSDYYVLSLLDESSLDHVKQISRVWARNGNSRSAKAYGML